MGEPDIAQIRAIFERDSQQNQIIVGSKSSSEKRVVASLGLSPGALSTNRRKMLNRNQLLSDSNVKNNLDLSPDTLSDRNNGQGDLSLIHI